MPALSVNSWEPPRGSKPLIRTNWFNKFFPELLLSTIHQKWFHYFKIWWWKHASAKKNWIQPKGDYRRLGEPQKLILAHATSSSTEDEKDPHLIGFGTVYNRPSNFNRCDNIKIVSPAVRKKFLKYKHLP